MGARDEPELISWTDFLMSADPATPYLSLFKALAQLAYVALGGGDIDIALEQARLTVETWTGETQRAGDWPRPATPENERRPVGHREASSARTAMSKQGEARRRMFERGCENVARLFYDVLKRHAFDRREPWAKEADAPPPPPVDPALEDTLRARASNFTVITALHEGPPRRNPGMEPFDEQKEAELTALRMRAREMEVHMMQMGMRGAGVEHEAGPEQAVAPDSRWAADPALSATAAEREPTDIEITAFSLALVEGELSAMDDMPQESMQQLKSLQMWFASHDTSGAPRAAVGAFVRRKFDQVFGPEVLREATKRSVVRLTAQGV